MLEEVLAGVICDTVRLGTQLNHALGLEGGSAPELSDFVQAEALILSRSACVTAAAVVA